MSKTFQAADGKWYIDNNGSYYPTTAPMTGAEAHAQFNQGGRSVLSHTDRNPFSVDDTKLVPPKEGLKGVQEGRSYGHTSPNAVDDPQYMLDHYPAMKGIDGEPITHAGSANHPLNNLHTPQPYRGKQ